MLLNVRIRVIALLSVLSFAGCSLRAPEFASIDGFAQGTTYHIVVGVRHSTDLAALREKIENLLAEVDSSLSIYNNFSVISRINANETDITDSLFRQVFRMSQKIYDLSGGRFDITVGPLVEEWGFGPDALRRFNAAKLDSLMALVGMEKVSLEGERIVRKVPGMFIDVNAIAQGYTVDLICDLLSASGLKEFLIEVGGEVRTVGDKNGMGWRVGIDRPEDNNNLPGADLQAAVRLDNLALATSGNYRKFYIDNGIKYSHTIDPRTGYPVRHTLLSATIVASDCATADAWATACMVAGKDTAISFIEQNRGIEGYLVFSDEKGEMKSWTSDGLKVKVDER